MTAVKVHVKLRQQTCSIELAIGHEILIHFVHFVYTFSVSKKKEPVVVFQGLISNESQKFLVNNNYQ